MRSDVSDRLVHLTKGTGLKVEEHRKIALKTLGKILTSKSLKGGTGYIKGLHPCVCFSEAPIGMLSHILSIKTGSGFKYQPYGVMVNKKWLYEKGGRPVIYGPDSDYSKLPDDMKFRHVRFEIDGKSSIDFTSEREWRIQTDELSFTHDDVTIIVPDRRAKDAFVKKFTESPWHYIVLSDLGVSIDAI
jgi:hypothetical protein